MAFLQNIKYLPLSVWVLWRPLGAVWRTPGLIVFFSGFLWLSWTGQGVTTVVEDGLREYPFCKTASLNSMLLGEKPWLGNTISLILIQWEKKCYWCTRLKFNYLTNNKTKFLFVMLLNVWTCNNKYIFFDSQKIPIF